MKELQQIVEDGLMDMSVSQRYLELYVGLTDWPTALQLLYTRIYKKYGGYDPKNLDIVKLQMKEMVSCAVLLPAVDRSVHPDPEQMLPRVFQGYYHQFHERKWFPLLRKVVERDLQIIDSRNQVWSLGYIEQIHDQPFCRQAYNWLYERAEETGAMTPENKEDIVRRFSRIVEIYGGAVISNIFTRHEKALNGVVNWRTAYFLERVIFEVYTPEQVMKIKRAELDKTSEKLVVQKKKGSEHELARS